MHDTSNNCKVIGSVSTRMTSVITKEIGSVSTCMTSVITTYLKKCEENSVWNLSKNCQLKK
jgi:hypothetical protein